MNETTTSRSCCATRNITRDETASAPSATTSGTQEIRITVQGGYSPKAVKLERGVPARLVFDRQESSRCSEELLIPAFGVRAKLPRGVPTVVELTPSEAGTFAFTCGMEMLRGQLVVE